MPGESFRVTHRKNYVTLQLFEESQTGAIDALEKFGADFLGNPGNLVVSCAGLRKLPDAWLEKLQFIDKQLKTSGKRACVIYASPEVENALKKPKTGASLEVLPDLAAALEVLVSNRTGQDKVHFIKAFVAATLRTVYIQAGCQSKQGRIFVLGNKENGPRLLGDISGVIQVDAPAFRYVVIVSFPEKTYLALISKMLDKTFTQITDEIADGATELLNIIFGQAKLVLNSRNAGIKPQIPLLIRGKNLPADRGDKLAAMAELIENGKVTVVPFQSEVGDFFVQVCFPLDFTAEMLRR